MPRTYDERKERAREQQAEQSRAGRDIGKIPPPADVARRLSARSSLRRHCELYHPAAFTLAWSKDHLDVIAKIEECVMRGGLFAQAMPRGSGKTTITEVAAEWAVLHGWRRFVSIIAASADKGKSLLEEMKTWFECNDLLAEDFPEVCVPIVKLERITSRQKGQTCLGEPTRLEWGSKKLVLPTIRPDWPEECLREFCRDGLTLSSGSVISAAGMKGGEIRGQKHTVAGGSVIRPDFAIIDDPQTRESADSALECRKREKIMAGDVLGMAGPGKDIAAVTCCTVIAPGDLADNILDRTKHPRWQGHRTKLIYHLPDDWLDGKGQRLWAKYDDIRDVGLQNGDATEATEFYRQNRAAMDAGAVVAWPERFSVETGEISAVQNAMNLLLDDPEAFWAEYQNEPLREDHGATELTAGDVTKKASGILRRVVPADHSHLTAFIDVQQDLLFWVVCSWRRDFSGHVVDYGAWPDQRRAYFTLRQARPTLESTYPKSGVEAALLAGLNDLLAAILGIEWMSETGSAMRVERCLIDANWSVSTEIVHGVVRRSPFAATLAASYGKGVGPSDKEMSRWAKRPEDVVGLNWRVDRDSSRRKRVIADVNFWKSTVHQRLATAQGDPGSMTLFGKPGDHQLFADHITSEYRVPTEGQGRKVDVWKLRPGRPDNHWLDCLVGCAVGASMLGCELLGAVGPEKSSRKRLTWAESKAQQRS